MTVKSLARYGGSRQLVDVLSSIGIKRLYPPQVMALKGGLLKGWDSFVVAAPTASGKTLIAEMAILKAFFEMGGKVIYIVPLRALAREKYEDFSKKYKGLGIRVVQSTGDYDGADPWLAAADLIISTNEKMDSLIRHRASWLRDISLVVADEIHLLSDPHRGPTLEIVLTRLRWMKPGLRFISLSATIPNASDIADWLGARLIESEWRPVPLREGVFFNDSVIFNDGSVRWIGRESISDAVNIAMETIREWGQALIFVNTRKGTETVAGKASKHIAALLKKKEKEGLGSLSEDIVSSSSEPTRVCRRLAECVGSGVAFHHAGIISSQRRLIEDAFRENRIKLIVATTTLAMGLNLPSRRVIIRDWWRYESGVGMQPIPVVEIKQMSGRAGRPGFDSYGEAVIIARDRKDERYLFENYIKGDPEDVESRLASESALRNHILASIAGGFTMDIEGLKDFLGNTFFAHQRGPDTLSSIVDGIVDFLVNEEMVVSERGGLTATRFGHRVSELYIDPLTGVVIRDSLRMREEKEVFPLLHMVSRLPDMMVLRLGKRDMEGALKLFPENAERLLIPDEERYPTDEILSEIKTAALLMEWISETPEDMIVGRFGVGPGDIRTMVELSDWLLYSSCEIARVFGLKRDLKTLSLLRTRVLYGVREELLPLVSLKGIGRVRARSLYNSGYRSLKDIRGATAEGLAKVPSIGKAIARDIKRQVLGE